MGPDQGVRKCYRETVGRARTRTPPTGRGFCRSYADAASLFRVSVQVETGRYFLRARKEWDTMSAIIGLGSTAAAVAVNLLWALVGLIIL